MASTQPSSDWRADVAHARAQAAVVHRHIRANAIRAVTVHGASSIDVALLIGFKQQTVERWIAAAAADPLEGRRALGATAYEIAQRYAAGDLSHEQMIDALVAWPYDRDTTLDDYFWDDVPVPQSDGAFSHTVGRALSNGLITAQDYDEILDRLPA